MTSPLELLPNTFRAFFSGFSNLTTAQEQLIQPILNGEDVILQASTGAGKTEASKGIMQYIAAVTGIGFYPSQF